MAKKALKSLASSNANTLNRTHLISLAVHALYLVLRSLFFTRRLTPYLILAFPALVIEFWFERIGRPTFIESPNGTKEVKRAGEDLEAPGLTEWMWDVVYWTWGNVVLVALFGDWAWWLWAVVPGYSAYLGFKTYTGMRQGMGGMMGGAEADGQNGARATGGQSKRQAKMEKRGGQRVQYR